MNKKLHSPSEKDLKDITHALLNIDQTIARSLAHIKKVQQWSLSSISKQFSGISQATIEKYMQPSYDDIRPIHFVAAFSWVTMVPMTSFFKDVKILETDRGMDQLSVEAIIQCGRLPKKHFKIILNYIYEHLNDNGKRSYDELYSQTSNEIGCLDDYNDNDFLPPETLNINDFAEDYYYSIALAIKDFRHNHQLSIETMARALGLSIARYELLENPNKEKINAPFSLTIGFRVRLAFRSHTHIEFTKYMRKFPQFHQLRKIQHIRDALIVEALRHVDPTKKESLLTVMKEFSRTHRLPKKSYISCANQEELDDINIQLKNANVTVSTSMKYIYTVQGWKYKDLEKIFSNIPKSTWQRYFQPSYKKMRPLHVVAAYSWLTMAPMSSFYKKINHQADSQNIDRLSTEAIIHCGTLPKQQFEIVLKHIYEYISQEDKNEIDIFKGGLERNYGALNSYENTDFMFPEKLDLEIFAKDYYRSVAIALKNFRTKNNISIGNIANILNMTTYAYKRCEDPNSIYLVPIEMGARLKLGFKLNNAIPFSKHMTHYPQFHTLRKVQHLREAILLKMFHYIHPDDKLDFVKMIKNIASIYTRSRHR